MSIYNGTYYKEIEFEVDDVLDEIFADDENVLSQYVVDNCNSNEVLGKYDRDILIDYLGLEE